MKTTQTVSVCPCRAQAAMFAARVVLTFYDLFPASSSSDDEKDEGISASKFLKKADAAPADARSKFQKKTEVRRILGNVTSWEHLIIQDQTVVL